jgi:hypothetical protein
MATYTYDDGSTISNDQLPSGWVTTSTPATDNGIGGWTSDRAEQAKMGQFYGGEKPWYEQAAMYGISRGIDAAFMSATANKTAAPATYAGANGMTYRAGSVAGGPGGGIDPTMLLLLCGVAALVAFA